MNRSSRVNALIDSEATYKFISQTVVDRLRLKAVPGKAPLSIYTINGTRLPVLGVYRQTLRL